jgi:hypothetical protein
MYAAADAGSQLAGGWPIGLLYLAGVGHRRHRFLSTLPLRRLRACGDGGAGAGTRFRSHFSARQAIPRSPGPGWVEWVAVGWSPSTGRKCDPSTDRVGAEDPPALATWHQTGHDRGYPLVLSR